MSYLSFYSIWMCACVYVKLHIRDSRPQAWADDLYLDAYVPAACEIVIN